MTRLGAAVTGIDAADRNIATARLHAERPGLAIDYRVATAEALADRAGSSTSCWRWRSSSMWPTSTSSCAAACSPKPGGLVFLSTLNRTAKALALAIAGAEYMLRWLPRGTHELGEVPETVGMVRRLRQAVLETQEIVGVVYSPAQPRWSLNARDLDVNYMLYEVAGR